MEISDGSSAATLDADAATRKMDNIIMRWEGGQV
jgi:hypothetical protein